MTVVYMIVSGVHFPAPSEDTHTSVLECLILEERDKWDSKDHGQRWLAQTHLMGWAPSAWLLYIGPDTAWLQGWDFAQENNAGSGVLVQGQMLALHSAYPRFNPWHPILPPLSHQKCFLRVESRGCLLSTVGYGPKQKKKEKKRSKRTIFFFIVPFWVPVHLPSSFLAYFPSGSPLLFWHPGNQEEVRTLLPGRVGDYHSWEVQSSTLLPHTWY